MGEKIFSLFSPGLRKLKEYKFLQKNLKIEQNDRPTIPIFGESEGKICHFVRNERLGKVHKEFVSVKIFRYLCGKFGWRYIATATCLTL